MLEVATNPEKCDAMGKAAAQKVGKGYSWADYGKRLLAIYQAHLAKKAK
jgi:glycosyltransferase involved in cell wall biosynthesis